MTPVVWLFCKSSLTQLCGAWVMALRSMDGVVDKPPVKRPEQFLDDIEDAEVEVEE